MNVLREKGGEAKRMDGRMKGKTNGGCGGVEEPPDKVLKMYVYNVLHNRSLKARPNVHVQRTYLPYVRPCN